MATELLDCAGRKPAVNTSRRWQQDAVREMMAGERGRAVVVAQALAAIAFVLLLLFAPSGTEQERPPDVAAATQGAQRDQRSAQRAEADRRAVFEQRRREWERAHHDGVANLARP